MNKLKIAIISNFLLGIEFKKILNNVFDNFILKTDLFTIEMINKDKIEIEEFYYDIVVVWTNIEMELQGDYIKNLENSQMVKSILEFNEIYNRNIYSIIGKWGKCNIWFGYDKYFSVKSCLFKNSITQFDLERYVNESIYNNLSDEYLLVDINMLIAELGINYSYNIKNYYRWGNPYSKALLELAGKEIKRQYNVSKCSFPKCIVLDCDNVLWGGILSEDGIENITLGNIGVGKRYYEFQKIILSLSNMGVLLCLCSKNDKKDVMNVFKKHQGMILKMNDIIIAEVNWNDKLLGIKNISKKLNIDYKDMMFIDDSYYETEWIKENIPSLITVLFDINKPFTFLNYYNLNPNAKSKRIKSRIDTYKTNIKRERLQQKCISKEEYLRRLNTKLKIKIAEVNEINNISELSMRTNKCTLGKRYTSNELKRKMIEDNYMLYSVYVSDIYCDFGLVSCIGISNMRVDLFCVSCRVLGRNIESEIISNILSKTNIDSFDFQDTGKNKWVYEIFCKLLL